MRLWHAFNRMWQKHNVLHDNYMPVGAPGISLSALSHDISLL